MRGQPLTNLKCYSSQGLIDGGRVGRKHLVPQPQRLRELSRGRSIHDRENLLLPTLTHEFGYVLFGQVRTIRGVERQLLDFCSENPGVLTDQVNQAGGRGGVNALALRSGLANDESDERPSAQLLALDQVAAGRGRRFGEPRGLREASAFEDQRAGWRWPVEIGFQPLALGRDERVGFADQDYTAVRQKRQREEIFEDCGQRRPAIIGGARAVIGRQGQ